MSSPHIEWSCSECRSVITDQRKYCAVCHSMLRWTCNGSGRSGLYTNYYRHRGSCSSCIVEMDEDQQQEIRDKQLSIQQEFHTLDDKQRPWSEWQRSDESCVQHTGLDVEQVQELYDMCEEPLKNTTIGYKNLHIDIYCLSSSLTFFFEIVDEKVIDTKEFREFEKNCIVSSLNQWIPTTTIDFEYFMSNLETENSYKPLGDQLLTYTLQEEESSPYFIDCIKHNLFSNSKFAEWWSHLEIFLIFFLNNVLTINEEDQNWFIYLLYQQYQNDNNQICYAPIGFTKVYLHYTYSNKKRPKISQMLILPPYQRKGHGRRLLKSIYNDLRNDSRVQDITESINKVNRLTKEMIDKAQEVRKLTKQRTRHVYENVFSSIN
ncbi:unnamed protein product [Rotaria sp. Silwood1]|nr:unnamed protein product [Rotaria sp. Silwood1]